MDRARTGRGRAALAALGLLLAAVGALAAFTIAFADIAYLAEAVDSTAAKEETRPLASLSASEDAYVAELTSVDLALAAQPLYDDLLAQPMAAVTTRPNAMDQVVSVVGPYRFNATGNSNTGGRYLGAYWNQSRYSARIPKASIGATLPADLGGADGKNSSSAVLSQTTSSSRIVRAYLVVAASRKTGTTALAENGFYLHGPKGGLSLYYPTTVFHDNSTRSSCYVDVTDFVKGQGYGWYSCLNIPFGTTTAKGTDCFGAWKLIVVEEDTALPARMIRLKLGGDGVTNTSNSVVTVEGDGLTAGVYGSAAAPSGELLISCDGADIGDSQQQMLYRTNLVGSTVAGDERVIRPARQFFTMQIDVRGTRPTLDPAPTTALVSVAPYTAALTKSYINNGATFTQSNTDLSIMAINDAANASSPKVISGTTSVTVSTSSDNNPMLVSAIGLAVDVKVPVFQSTLTIENLGDGTEDFGDAGYRYSTAENGYSTRWDYAVPGDRLRAVAVCDNVSGGSTQIGIKRAEAEVKAPAFASIDADSVVARYVMPDGTEVPLPNVTVSGTTVSVMPDEGVNLASGGKVVIEFTGTAATSASYVTYENEMWVTGTFVDEGGNDHFQTTLNKLGSARTTTASDVKRSVLTAEVGANTGKGTVTSTGTQGLQENETTWHYPSDGSSTVSGAPAENSHTQVVVVDGVVRDDLIPEGGSWSVTVPMEGADHAVGASYRLGDKPVRAFYPIETAGDSGFEALTPTTLVAAGASHTVTWKAAVGYRVVSVTVDGVPLPVGNGQEGTIPFAAVKGDHRVEVRTEATDGTAVPAGFALRTQILGGEGTITLGDLAVPAGESRTVSWTAAAGWKVRSIEVDGAVLGGAELNEALAAGTLSFDNIQANHAVVVTLQAASLPDAEEKALYQVDVSFEGEGEAGPSATVAAGGSHTVTWKASSGYAVLMVEVDGVGRPDLLSAAQSGSLDFGDLSADHEVHVRFTTVASEPPTVQTYSVTLRIHQSTYLDSAVITNANLASRGFGSYVAGTTVTVSISDLQSKTSSSSGKPYYVWVDGVSVKKGFDNNETWTYTFSNLSANHVVDVGCSGSQPSLEYLHVSSEGPGTASGDTAFVRPFGGTSSWTAYGSAYAGARLKTITVNGVAWNSASFGGKLTLSGLALSTTLWPNYSQGAPYYTSASSHEVRVHYVFEWSDERVPVTARVTGGPGTVTGEHDVPLARGTSVSWAPAAGWHVADVKVNGASQPGLLAAYGTGAATHAIASVTAATDIEVVVEPDPPKLTAEAAPAEGGTAEAPAEGTVAWGDPATFTWAAAEGWRVASITANGLPVSEAALPLYDAAGSWTAPAAKGDIHFKVAYERIPAYRVAVSAEGNGAASVASGAEEGAALTVLQGGSAEVGWAPAAGWRVAGVWDGDEQVAGASEGAGSYRLDDIRADHEVRVVFERAAFTVTTHADDALGTITGTAEVPRGADHVVSWSVHDPEKAFVEDVLVDGTSAGDTIAAAGRYEFANVAADHDVAARFARIPDKALVVVTASGGGEGHLVGGAGPAFPAGSSAALGWTAQEGYTVKGAYLAVSDADRNPVAELSRPLAADEVAAGLADGFALENLREGHLYELHLTFELTRFALTTSSEGRGTVTPAYEETWGSDARVAFTPAAGWKVASVTVDGKESAEAADAGFVVFEDLRAGHTVHVTFAPIMLTASIAGTPVAGGSVSLAAVTPDGTAVSRDGGAAGRAEASVPWGSRVALSWQAAPGWRVKTVAVNGEERPDLARDATAWTTTALDADAAVAVAFERIPCTVTATGEPAEGGTVSGGGTLWWGESATVAYEAKPGWHVASIEVDGAPWPVEAFPASLTLTDVRSDRTVKVAFERDGYPLTLTVSDKAGGTIAGPSTVLHGEDAAVTWKAAEGWAVTGVAIDGQPADVEALGGAGGGNATFAAVDGPHAVHVTVERLTFPVTVAVTEGNGDASPSATVAFGEDATVTWAPAAGWEVREVRLDGVPLDAADAAAGALTIPDVRTSHRVEVAFARQVFRIETFADRTLGSLTSSADVPAGEDFPVRWSPNAGAYVVGVEADGAAVTDAEALAAGEYWFRDVRASHTFAVEFAKVPGRALVAVVASGEGAFSVADGAGAARGDGLFDPGETARVGWQPAEGWRVAGATLAVTDADGVRGEPVALDDAQLAAALEGALRLPAGDGALQEDFIYQVSVAFEPIRYPITTAAGPAEGGSITASYEAAHGSDAAVSIVPNPGWRVAEVMVDGAADEAAAEAGRVSFAAVTGPHAVVATFEQIMHRVSISAGPEGSGTVAVGGPPEAEGPASASAELPWGSPATLQWRPAEGWRVSSVTVNGASQPGLAAGAEAWETASLTEDVSVEVSLERIRCGVLVSVSDPAGATVTAPEAVNWGDDARVAWAVEPGWHVARVIVNGEERPELAGPDAGEVLLEAVRSGQSVHVEVARDDAGNPGGPEGPDGPIDPGPNGPEGSGPDSPGFGADGSNGGAPSGSVGEGSPGAAAGAGGQASQGAAAPPGSDSGDARAGESGGGTSDPVTVLRHLAQTGDGAAVLTLALAAAALLAVGALALIRRRLP